MPGQPDRLRLRAQPAAQVGGIAGPAGEAFGVAGRTRMAVAAHVPGGQRQVGTEGGEQRRIGMGVKAGGVGDVACFSFFPSKNLAVGGEGGMMMTRREDLAARMDALVNHGRDARLESHELGSNLRMSEVTASIGRVQLRRLEGWLSRRRAIAQRYHEAFTSLPGLTVPVVREGTQHAWHQYCLLVEEPQPFRDALEKAGVDSRVYYATPCHRQQVYARHPQHETAFPVTDDIAHRLVAIPVFHQMTDDEVQRVIDAVIASTSSES